MDLTDGEVCAAPLCLSLLPAVAVARDGVAIAVAAARDGCEGVAIAVAGVVDGPRQHP